MISPEKIYKKGLCLGCGICNAISEDKKVNFIEDEKGKFKPISASSKKMNNLDKICPGIYIENDRPLRSKYELIWGHYKSIYKGFATHDEIRFKGSSGGALTATAIFLLDKQIVDGILHLQETSVPLKYSLTLSRSKDDLINSAGSKYIASDYLINIREILSTTSGSFAFIGKPCDISAVKQLLKYDDELKDRISIYLSFFCAGLPTLKTVDKICEKFEFSRQDIDKIHFRGNGWPGEFKINTKNNKEYSLSYDDSWGKFLGRDIHFRCKICPDGVGKIADIAFGDAWEIKDNKPDFSEKPGSSLIFTRSELGENLIQQAVKENFLKIYSYDINFLQIIQKYQYKRGTLISSRLSAFKIINSLPIYKGFGLIKIMFNANLKLQLKDFMGLFKRKFLNSI